MATKYVNKSGSNSNDGSTPTLAKLTIAAAISVASSGDTIVVGSGKYNEALSIYNKAMIFQADGVVMLDGTSLAVGSAITANCNVSGDFNGTTFQKAITGGKWIVQNYVTSGDSIGTVHATQTGNTGGTEVLYLSDMEFYGNANNKSGTTAQGSGYYNTLGAISATNCVFVNYAFAGMNVLNSGGANSNSYAYYCTFYNCAVGIYKNIVGLLGACYNNIFHTCTTSVYVVATNPSSNMNYNIHYNFTNILTVATTNYTTLAAVQGVGSELKGFTSNPGLIDPANGVFYLASIGNYGAKSYSANVSSSVYNSSKWIVTASKNDTGWYCAGGLISKNATDGALELTSGTSDTLESPVFDNGANVTNTQISLVVDQTWPTNMIDTTKTDVRPNYQTIQMRSSNTPFVQADASPSWVEVNIESPITQVGRYVQVKLTLRTDDVGA